MSSPDKGESLAKVELAAKASADRVDAAAQSVLSALEIADGTVDLGEVFEVCCRLLVMMAKQKGVPPTIAADAYIGWLLRNKVIGR